MYFSCVLVLLPSFAAHDADGHQSAIWQVIVNLCGACEGRGRCDFDIFTVVTENFYRADCDCSPGWTGNTISDHDKEQKTAALLNKTTMIPS